MTGIAMSTRTRSGLRGADGDDALLAVSGLGHDPKPLAALVRTTDEEEQVRTVVDQDDSDRRA